jgi:hypothetical protein
MESMISVSSGQGKLPPHLTQCLKGLIYTYRYTGDRLIAINAYTCVYIYICTQFPSHRQGQCFKPLLFGWYWGREAEKILPS